MASLSLSELLDAAIGTPEVGAVNFNALHSLLYAMLQHLGLQHLPAAGRAATPGEQPQQRGQPPGTASSTAASGGKREEGEGKDGADGGGSKAVPLSQNLLEELGGMKAAQSQMGEDLRMIKGMLGLGDDRDAAGQQWGWRDGGSDSDRLSTTESSESDEDTRREDRTRGPKGRQRTRPAPGDGKGTAGTQPDSLETQARIRRALQSPEQSAGAASDQAWTSGAAATTPGTQLGSPGTQVTSPGMQPGSPGTQITSPGTQMGSPGAQVTSPGMQPGSPSTQPMALGTQPGSPGTMGTQPGSPGTMGTQPGSPGTMGTQPWPQGGAVGAQPGAPSTAPHTQTVPSGATPGAMGTGVDDVYSKGRGEASRLLSPTALGAETSGIDTGSASPPRGLAVPEVSGHDVGTAEALKQLSHLCNALEERVAKLEVVKLDRSELEELRLPFLEGGQENITIVLTDLRDRVSALQGMASDLQGEKEKIKQLQDAFEKLGVMGADGKVDGSLQMGSVLQQLKRELKELKEKQDASRAVLEQLVADTAGRLQEQLDELRSMLGSTEPAGHPHGRAEQDEVCPVCSTDVGAQLGRLLQRYEQLQELVESVSARQAASKAGRQRAGRGQDEELLKHIQAAIAQVQGDCEKLSCVTGNLMDDRHQRQRDIEALFQSLERLEKEKVDKEQMVLEIDVKADRASLAGKVSCAQFDAAMEQLNGMIEEMVSKVTGQEQDWHQIQQKLIEELDSKLDRLELAPLRQQLEERWRSVLKQLKESTPRLEADDAAGIRKQLLAHFHCMSCDRALNMLVPGPHIVTIPPLPALPSRVPVRPRGATFQPEHVHREQGAPCGLMQVPRHCGGQHTVTHPLQRCPRPPHGPPYCPAPPQPHGSIGKEHAEMELLGQDGHIYKGRWDVQLPALAGKEGSPRDKAKPSPRQWGAQDTNLLPMRPHSALYPLSQPGTPRLQEQRPVSSHGRLPHLWPPQGREENPRAESRGGTPYETHPWAPGGPMGCGQLQ
ncbi:glutamine-rich protein 2 [Excalfactoria chinensis]|uniref:glutamine-rich protein 2 n=1 Tax=Excalfactoria chinensis TaxID=46218 RepID=UPI003B39FB71